VPAAAREHPPEGELRAEDRAVQVDVDLAPRDLVRLLVERPDPVDASVVHHHHHRQRPVALLGLVEEGRELPWIGDVERRGERIAADLRGHSLGGREIHVAHRHSRAGPREMQGDRAADAVAATGYGGRRSLE
jgi:hypothetical protein